MELTAVPAERTAAATDALVALVAAAAILRVRRAGARDPWKAGLWSAVFALVALAAALGGIAHGFVLPEGARDLLWHPLYLALGIAVGLFGVGVILDRWGRRAARRALPAFVGMGAAFYAVRLAIAGTFLAFVLYEAAVMLFALAVYARLALARRLPGAGRMAAGILVTLVAAAIQATGTVAITVVWPFDHNGLFHLVQAAGIGFLVSGLGAAFARAPAPEAGGAR